MKKTVFFILSLFTVCSFGPLVLSASENAQEPCVCDRILAIQKRGLVNILTSPGELVRTWNQERKDHPKAWRATYLPQALANIITRAGSGVNDLLVLPWGAGSKDELIPLTRRFELPDYFWEKE